MTPAKKEDIQEYAGGWMTERKGTDAPRFLKFAFPVIAAGAAVYFFLYMHGETTNADRGQFVQQLNAATEASGILMYAVAAMVIVFGIVVVVFALAKPHQE